MIKKIIRIIHDLRIIFLLLIIFGFFGVVGINPVNLSQFLGAKFGQAIGMSVSIPENPFNKLALQLKEKEERLNAREAELAKRENVLTTSGVPAGNQDKLVFYLMIGIIILFILVVANYYLDYKRRQKEYNLNKPKQ
jgi:hypothetical protein